jgi:hypothetical protein
MAASTSRTLEYADYYADHLWKLLNIGDLWIKRRVVSCTVIDGETLKIHVSIDFDLNECEAGREYLKKTRSHLSCRDLPILLPIGLYRDPLVGFDLRDSADSRISFIAKRESGEITRLIKEHEEHRKGSQSPLLTMLHSAGLAIGIVELPPDGSRSTGRDVLNYAYLRRWQKDNEAFPFLWECETPGKSRNDHMPWSKEWWRRQRMLLGWHPMRVVIPLWNVRYSQSFHVELQTPEGIRIHEPGIFAKDGSEQVKMSGPGSTGEAPPGHSFCTVDYGDLRKRYPLFADETLAFRTWLSLDRHFMGVLLFLAVFNTAVSVAAVTSSLFMGIGMTNFVTVQALAAAAAFAYLYVPGEHGLSRGLYAPVRRTSVWIAALGLAIALDLSILEPHREYLRRHFPAWGTYGAPFLAMAGLAAVMFSLTVVLGISFVKVTDWRVIKWLYRHRCQHEQFGWHIEG